MSGNSKKKSLILTISVAISAIIFTAFVIFFVIMIQHQEQLFVGDMVFYGESISQTILSSLEHGMMKNDSTEIKRTIDAINKQEMIKNIVIYTHQGDVMHFAEQVESMHFDKKTSRECSICHHKEKIEELPEQLYYFNDDSPKKCLTSMILPIKNKKGCSTSNCHVGASDSAILGFLRMDVCRQRLEDNLDKSVFQLLITSLIFIIAITTLIIFFFKKYIMEPLQKLALGTTEISKGNLESWVDIKRNDEIGILARSYNKMVSELIFSRGKLEQLNENLEQRVEEKTQKLKIAQHQIIQAEKMSSLGRLAAVIAHEINNPISGIIVFINLIKKIISKENVSEEKLKKVGENLDIMESEAKRCGHIVTELLSFSRQGDKVEKCHIDTILNKAIAILNHNMKTKNIELCLNIENNLPEISCIPGQIQQIFMNLIQNAMDAMDTGGDLVIAFTNNHKNNQIIMRFKDSGTGIPKENIKHLFEPFYSSKDKGQSIGIGLFIVYGFIEQHNGTIEVSSEEGMGTEFLIKLPY